MRITYYFISFFLLFSFFSCKKTDNYTHLKGNALGTNFTIKYQYKYDFSNSIDSLFHVINASLSTYHPNSIISRINKADTNVVTDIHFEKVFKKAKRIFNETDGYFDPSVGVLVNAWGFGPKKISEIPDSTAITNLLKWVGFDKVNLSNHQIHKQFPEIYIDFNAIAKGYSVDVIGSFFESKNIKNYLIEIGGEMRVRGVNPQKDLWRVGIEKPLTDGTRAIKTTRQLDNQSMATSGNYRKFKVDENGNKYVHTINAKTGFTEQNDILSASVISKLDCADVDAYATSFMAMGYKRTQIFLKDHPELEVVLIYINKKSDIQVFDSKND
jgi:thiamine biosynthesis lipoprotein